VGDVVLIPKMYETSSRRPPGPKPHFLIGNLPLASPEPLAVFAKWAREFGDIFYYRAAWIRVFFINRPDLIESVLVTNYQSFHKDRVLRNNRWFFGDGLLTSEGAYWLRQRRLIQPAFHRDRIASYARTMTDSALEMLNSWKDGEVRDVHQDMMHLTMRIVSGVLFNTAIAEEEIVATALNVLMAQLRGGRMLLPGFVRHIPLPTVLRARKAVRQLDKIVYGIIRQGRARNHDSGDFLSLLLAAQHEDGTRMTDRQLRDEVMAFLVAGHETTALALTWTFYLMSQHPEVERKLRQELDTTLQGRAPQPEDLPRLAYTEKVIKEAIRLYPPAWGLGRTAIKPCEVGGYEVPAGASVVMSQWVMHRNPLFFPDPERFSPERWTPERVASLPKFAYFPFGGGPRSCVGASFAMMEAVLLLAVIAQNAQLHLATDRSVAGVPGMTLRPKEEIRMTIFRS
jgi:cytochrome P450